MQAWSALFVVVCLISGVKCYSFNAANVQIISQNSVQNTYFSYSLLLQAGENKTSSLIVGAPKNVNNPFSGGDIYKCDLSKNSGSTCILYPTGRTINSNTPNGNFFGMKLDGDSHIDGALVACAPRTLPAKKSLNFLRGYCIYMKNTSQVTQPPIEIIPLEKAGYDSNCCDSEGRAYYDLGFAMAGFDVSYHSERNILLGAPGVKKFNGAVLSYSIDEPRIVNMLPYRKSPSLKDEDSYFGYSVAFAEFQRNNKEVWIVTGAPRANHLRGKVTIYFYDVMAKEKMYIVASFEDDEMGSYFGESILPLDVTNDRVVDLLVGAPMKAGKTWDEGAVYFYRGLNFQSFLRRVKLTGSSKIGGRFGSSIVSLGDFDLDGCNDIAISAPYEDDGRGAVYIYRGSTEGLTDQFSQRLSPEDFGHAGIVTKGFGMGISKGNDIDGNGHNDIAIGAYKSDQVFIIKSYSIIDYRFQLTPEINLISDETRGFNLQFCLIYTKRSEKPILQKVQFELALNIDYRSKGGNIRDQLAINLGENTCRNYAIQLKQTVMDISPFQIGLSLDVKTENIVAHGEKSLRVQIPFSHGCGDDNVCDTDLTIELQSEGEKLVLGLDKEISVNVSVNNNGEPAYQCEVKLSVSDGLELRNMKDCVKTQGNYTCTLSERLVGATDKTFIFDVRKDITPDIKSIDIRAEVVSLGINKATHSDNAHVQLPIVLHNVPYILSKSWPKNMELELPSSVENVEVLYQFSVGNNGLSPLQLDVDILIPIVEHDGESVLSIVDVISLINDIQVPCSRSVVEGKLASDGAQDLDISYNRTIVLACKTEDSCMKFSCQGDYLYGSTELATFKIKLLIKTHLLVAKYEVELMTKNLIALIPVAYQKNITGDRIAASGMFLIFVHAAKSVPLWVYILAPTIGVIILILISYALYRCHFFDRIYKDKLEKEKILISNDASIEDEIFDNVVFRPMEENIRNKEKDYIM